MTTAKKDLLLANEQWLEKEKVKILEEMQRCTSRDYKRAERLRARYDALKAIQHYHSLL